MTTPHNSSEVRPRSSLMSFRFLALILIASWCVGPIRAQEQPVRQADPARLLTPAARARVVRSDTTLGFRTRAVEGGRMDMDAGVLRAAYRVQARVDASGSPEAAARDYLRQAARQFGWPDDARDLVVHAVRAGAYSSHVVFQQVLEGVPVYNRYVAVNLDADRQPTMVLSGYATHLASVRDFSTVPGIPSATARQEAAQAVSPGPVTTTDPELVVYPSQRPRLAWRVIAWPQNEAAEWEVLLDAHTGELIHLINQVTHAKQAWEWEGERIVGKAEHEGKDISEPYPAPVSVPAYSPIEQNISPSRGRAANRTEHALPIDPPPVLSSSAASSLSFTDGSGLVFDPDPVTSAGVEYGGAYQDRDDADAPELTAQLKPVVLKDLTLRNGRYYLEGPYVTITGSAAVGGNAYEPPSETDPNAFRYTRSDDRFEAVMAYYHIDQSQRYVQSLDVGRPIHATPIRVNPHGEGGEDAAYFYPWQDAISFGTGGIDDAEDAQVIWHEYAHALLEASAPGHITGGGDGLALHEGWADYWAASYVRDKVERGELPATDWRRLFRWDGNNPPWCGRTLDHDGYYPDDIRITVPPGCSIALEYQRAVLWATTLMEIYTALGRTVTDRLNLASHGYLGAPPVTFPDAAEAILQADVDLYGGAHVEVLTTILKSRGFLGATSAPPRIEHVPVQKVDRIGPVEIRVTVAADSPPVEDVFVYYRTNGGAFRRIRLTATEQGYRGTLDLPAYPAKVDYYVRAVAASGRRVLLPGRAPVEVYSFETVPDEPRLYPNFPEPFSHTTKVVFHLLETGHVKLELYDLIGRRVMVLEDGEREAGTHTIILDGSSLASGTYFLRMRAGNAQWVEPVTVTW